MNGCLKIHCACLIFLIFRLEEDYNDVYQYNTHFINIEKSRCSLLFRLLIARTDKLPVMNKHIKQ